ncbi:MAG: TonB-dependent receptor [Saprospiraceae bacterium]|nr:TonB-dependent receptor [Lewinella sp.]
MKKVLFFLLIAHLAQAQSDVLLQDTSATVVITAQRQAIESFQLAEAVSVLSQTELQRQVSRSTAEALIGTAGVWMQKTNHGGGSPFLRGLTGNQTLLLLDGIRLNNATYRYGPNQYFNTINVLNIDRIEVVRGSGAVLYGSDALGGTINVLTRSPKFSDDRGELQAEVVGRMISSDMEQTLGANVEWSAPRVAVFADYYYRDFGDLVAGGDLGIEAPSSYTEQAASAKIKWKWGGSSIITLAYDGVFQANVGRYDQVAQRGYSQYEFDPQNRQLAYLRGQTVTDNPLFQRLEWTASWQFSEEGRTKLKENSTTGDREVDEVTTLGLNVQVHSNFSRTFRLLTGVESYWDRIHSYAYQWEESPDQILQSGRGLYPDNSRAGNVALYTTATADLNKLRLNAGLRYNFFNLRPNDEQFKDAVLTPRALVGNLSANVALGTHHALTGSISTAFRAPNINDLSSFGSFDFGIEVPTSDLDPERSLNLEIGHKYQSENIQSNFSIYRMQLYDLITRIRGSYQGQTTWQGEDVYLKANTAEAYIRGLEWDGRWSFHQKWAAGGSIIYTYGQDESADSPMRRIPPLNGNLFLSFQPAAGWIFTWTNWWASKQDRLSGGDISDHRIAEGGTPGWWVSNINIGFQKGRLQMNGGLQNIFDEAYRIHGSGVDGVGRSLWLSLRFRLGKRRAD